MVYNRDDSADGTDDAMTNTESARERKEREIDHIYTHSHPPTDAGLTLLSHGPAKRFEVAVCKQRRRILHPIHCDPASPDLVKEVMITIQQ